MFVSTCVSIREFYICEIQIFADIYYYFTINTRLSEICIFEVSSDNYLPILTGSDILLIFILTLSSVKQNVQEQNIYQPNTMYRNKEPNYTKTCYSIRNNSTPNQFSPQSHGVMLSLSLPHRVPWGRTRVVHCHRGARMIAIGSCHR